MTLLVLLTIGMLMVNFVMTIFWQQDLVRSQTDSALRLIPTITTQRFPQGLTNSNDLILKKNITEMLQETEGLCGVILQKSQYVFSDNSSACETIEVFKLLGEVHQNGSSDSVTFGTTWGVFAPGKRYFAVAIPTTRAGNSGSFDTLGVVFPLTPVYQSIRSSQPMVFAYLTVNLLILVVIGLFRFVNLTVKPLANLVKLTDSYSEKDGVPFFISGKAMNSDNFPAPWIG